jgi:hypothetical protein
VSAYFDSIPLDYPTKALRERYLPSQVVDGIPFLKTNPFDSFSRYGRFNTLPVRSVVSVEPSVASVDLTPTRPVRMGPVFILFSHSRELEKLRCSFGLCRFPTKRKCTACACTTVDRPPPAAPRLSRERTDSNGGNLRCDGRLRCRRVARGDAGPLEMRWVRAEDGVGLDRSGQGSERSPGASAVSKRC